MLDSPGASESFDGDVGLLVLRDLPAPRSPPRSARPHPSHRVLRPAAARDPRAFGAGAGARAAPRPSSAAPARAGNGARSARLRGGLSDADRDRAPVPLEPLRPRERLHRRRNRGERGVSSSTLIRRRNVATESGEANRAVPAVGRTWLGPAR